MNINLKKLISLTLLFSTQYAFSVDHLDLKSKCVEEYSLISQGNLVKYKTINRERWQNFGARCDYKVFDTKKLNNLQNKSDDFVGIEGMKKAQLTQDLRGLGSLEKFRSWSKANQWYEFSSRNHFDWWMFPIGDESSQGYAYTVLAKDIEMLKNDKVFLNNYREGLRLMFLSWGWNLESSSLISNPGEYQRWRGYDVRLRKALLSMYLFSQDKYFESGLRYLEHLESSDQVSKRSSIFRMLGTIGKLN